MEFQMLALQGSSILLKKFSTMNKLLLISFGTRGDNMEIDQPHVIMPAE